VATAVTVGLVTGWLQLASAAASTRATVATTPAVSRTSASALAVVVSASPVPSVPSPSAGSCPPPTPIPTTRPIVAHPAASTTPSASPAPVVSPVPEGSPTPDLCASTVPEPSTAVGLTAEIGTGVSRSSGASSSSPVPSPSPTQKPSPVVPGGIRTRLGVAMTRRLPCYEFPRDGCVNRVNIYFPKNQGRWPTVVTIHGRPRTPADMRELGRALARRGAVVFNADYRGVRPVSKGFPESVEDVACAIRFARANTARYGGDPDHIVLVGHSMGGYVGMMVSIAGNRLAGRGEGCLVDKGSSLPDGFVHLAGVSLIHPDEKLDQIFFGGTIDQVPDQWRRGNVYNQIEQGGNQGLKVGIIFELHDPFLGYAHATWLQAALRDEGYASRLTLLEEGSTHFDVLDMDTALGQKVLRLVLQVIRRSAPRESNDRP